ncbi:hypothetical protein B0T17DRAFT_503820 [Bombardia bombarda]|uniref:3'-5' exonuclease domain-containing protein n=1 Tax=Bombardia bombarda TaxID=252184 RepID=A0AA39XMJ8_9PEZI|nr:hypothetical protein B0T17DRAFT_503820 [Bombardia bombarda]
MESPDMTHKTWHISRGIVFAGDTRVAYPRLPMGRYHSSPAVVEHGETETHLFASPINDGGGKTIDLDTKELTHSRPSPTMGNPADVVDGQDGAPSAAETSTDPLQPEEDAEDPATIEPPFTPLDFKIPPEVFRAAKKAALGTPESFWTYNLYRGPGKDGASETKVKVHYCTTLHTTERVLKEYFVDEKVLGFDLEWAPDATKAQGARRNVCVAQLASESRIAIFHLALFPKNDSLVAPTFKKIMEDPDITKLGVWIKGDCTRLRNFLEIDSRGILELSNLYKLVKYSTTGEYQFVNRKLVSLSTQVLEYLDLPLFKGQDVRSSDWSRPLKMDQIIYSASDAYAAVHLFAILDHHRKKLDPTPPLPHHAERNLPIRLADGVLLPTPDAASEPTAPPAESTDDGPELSTDYLKTLDGSIQIEAEADGPDSGEQAAPALQEPVTQNDTATTPAAQKTTCQPKPPKDARITEAELWASQYRLAHPPTSASGFRAVVSGPALRAYYLWRNNEDLHPERIAALLRDPPLKTSTMVSYILDAIRLDKLPYDKARMRAEVACSATHLLQLWWYKEFLKELESDESAEGQGGGEDGGK